MLVEYTALSMGKEACMRMANGYRFMAACAVILSISGCDISFDGDDSNKVNGSVHVPVGKASFPAAQIEENARAVIDAVAKARPNSVKGAYIHTCTLSATMSPPVSVDIKEFTTH